MPTVTEWWVYLGAVVLIAVAPGPGLLYVLARSVRGGRREGIRSALGNGCGASVHVVAAALGLSAVLATSAVAFTLVKFAGAAYLVWLGARALWELRRSGAQPQLAGQRADRSAVLQGFVVEVLNPKTAMFFLAFIPQFVHSERGSTVLAFFALGAVFVVCASLADVVLALVAGPVAGWIARHPRWWRRQQVASGLTLIGLGGALAVTQRAVA
ncbi:LysE family translocator [Salinifilum aidingensis]